jgi:hypothetical protein
MAVIRDLRSRADARPAAFAGLLLVLIVLLSTVVRGVVSSGVPVPWIFVDELIYSELGRSAFSGFAIRGVPVSGYGPVYPYLIAPAYAIFDNLVTAYTAAKWTNSFVMSLAAVPVYFAASMLVRRAWALGAALLAVLIPGMTYTTVVMTESAFHPAFALAFLLILRSLRRPTIVSQVLVFAAAALCFEIRPQGLVVAPAFIVSALVIATLDVAIPGEGTRLSNLRLGVLRFLPTWLVAVAGLVGVANYENITGRTLSSALGAYSITVESGTAYAPKIVASWTVLHVAETALWLGVIPVVALFVLFGAAVRSSESREVRVFAAAALPLVVLMTMLVSAFLIFSNVGRIEERNLFYIGPIFLIAFCWWLATPSYARLAPWGQVLLVAACGLPLLIPFQQFFNQSAVSDTFGLFVPWALSLRINDPSVTVFVIFMGCVMASAVAVCLRPRTSVGVFCVLGVFFLISAIAVERRTNQASRDTQAGSIQATRNWIDAQGLGDESVVAVYPGGTDPLRLWEAEFFNRSVGSVYTLNAPLAGSLPETVVQVDAQGRVLDMPGNPVVAEYALADRFNMVEGAIVASDDEHRMAVVKVDVPMRIPERLAGVYGDGWSGPALIYTRYACTGGVVTIGVSSELKLRVGPVPVTPRVGERTLESVPIPPTGQVVPVSVRLTPVDGVCQVTFEIPDTVIPQTVTGGADTRPLGVRVWSVDFDGPN